MSAAILRPRVVCAAVAFALLPLALPAAPQNVLVLGDSLSEEHAFELPFSAPDSDPGRANLRNWVGLLAATRPADHSGGYALTTIGWATDLAGPWQPVPAEWISAGSAASGVTLPAAGRPAPLAGGVAPGLQWNTSRRQLRSFLSS